MSATIQSGKLPYRISANNMHVTLEGRLSSDLAAELGGLVATHERDCATFFIDVRRMEDADPEAAERLKTALRRFSQPYRVQGTARFCAGRQRQQGPCSLAAPSP